MKPTHLGQIREMFAVRTDITRHLEHFTQELMRGQSDLSPGFRELIAAYSSRLNHCRY